ncbi:hypothetical protein PTI98_008340 [Pleurotus ostreatus]|nr:hypothetical protein PTI98_008340 [Pleurotus ostreatus]
MPHYPSDTPPSASQKDNTSPQVSVFRELTLPEYSYILEQWTPSPTLKVGPICCLLTCFTDALDPQALDEYIKELTKLDAEDPDFVDTVQEIHRILAADPELAGKAPNFTPIASGGTLRFSVPRVGGHGACEKTGTGAFYVNESKKHMQGGTFELTFTRTSVEVKLYSGGALVDTLKGRGLQKGLSNRGGVPWKGTWTPL